MPRFPRRRLIPVALVPIIAAGFVATTQLSGFNATGNRYYTLAFVISQGTCNASINGDTAITDAGWNGAVNSLRAVGGDVIASFGGASGTEIGVSCTSVSTVQAQYKRVIDQMNLTRID